VPAVDTCFNPSARFLAELASLDKLYSHLPHALVTICLMTDAVYAQM
jgi:hypothetical protein